MSVRLRGNALGLGHKMTVKPLEFSVNEALKKLLQRNWEDEKLKRKLKKVRLILFQKSK